ncbi:hypothetical protein DIPPA_20059 [Diplonema papillatum]|nr:hypothetical protein DIPPA_20059 [Diplonema papillatum]
MDRQAIFEQYMRDDDLGRTEEDAATQIFDGSPPGVSQQRPMKPPLYPHQSATSTGSVPGYGSRLALSQTQLAPSTPQPQQPVPILMHSVPDTSPSHTPEQRSQRMLRQQEEELVRQEQMITTLKAVNEGLRAHVSLGSGSTDYDTLKQKHHELLEKFEALKLDHEEAGSLTAEAGILLQKVQSDLDEAQTAAVDILEKISPSDALAVATRVENVPQLIRSIGLKVETLHQNALDDAVRIERKLLDVQESSRAEIVALEKLASGEVPGTTQQIVRLEHELRASLNRNTELSDQIVQLQRELVAGERGQPGRTPEFQEKIKCLEPDLGSLADEPKPRRSQAHLLETTERTRICEDELRRDGEQAKRTDGGTIQGELAKLGMSSKHTPATWKSRWFAADATCVQYFESEEDLQARDPALVKGVRFYASQEAFVSSFRADSCNTVDRYNKLGPHATYHHPKAVDTRCFYFGFIPKADNALSQVFLLRTHSMESQKKWCTYLSRQFGIDSGCDGSEQGEREDCVSDELRKTEDTLRTVMSEQKHARDRVRELERETSALQEEVRQCREALLQKEQAIDFHKKDNARLASELAYTTKNNHSLSTAVQVATEETDLLKQELGKRRLGDELAVVDRKRISLAAVVCAERAVSPAESPREEPLTGERLKRLQQHDIYARGLDTNESQETTLNASRDFSRDPHEELVVRLQKVSVYNKRLAAERKEASSRLKQQEIEHDAQIAAFCDQVLRDMEAIRLQSKIEISRKEEEWQKELSIWQQLVAEKEQQIALTAQCKGAPEDAQFNGPSDVEEGVGYRLIGSQKDPTALHLWLSATGSMTDYNGILSSSTPGPRTYGTRIAVDKRRLMQTSVVDDPAATNSMSRTWKFKSVGSDRSQIVLSLAIHPFSGQQHEASALPPPRFRRNSTSSASSRRLRSSHRGSSPVRGLRARRHSAVFAP